ncbi:MAG: acyl carrier protein [Lachnospiraceae bacterium]|nr:acyl carrier protein [Lachnospiraceae bacterium]
MLDKIREILKEELNIDPEDVVESASFKEDLGVDSLDLFEMLMNLEEEYGFEIPAEDLETLETVGDVIDYLQRMGVEG